MRNYSKDSKKLTASINYALSIISKGSFDLMNMKKTAKAAVVLLLAAALACTTACGKTANAAEVEYIYGQIESVSGNEVTLLLMDYDEEKDNGNTTSEESGSKRSKPENMPEGFDPEQFKNGSMPEGFTKPDNMPEDFDPEQFKNGSMPEGVTKPENMPEDFDPEKFGNGEKPEGFTMPGGFDTADMPEGFDPKQFGSGRGDKKRSGGTTGEEKTVRIPVGTKVTTALGVETDFEVLQAGDVIKCSIEKNEDGEEIVTAVEIMEQ